MVEQPVIGVVVIDDHRMFAESIGRLLDAEEGLSVLGSATSAAEGLALVQRVKPAVVLVETAAEGRDDHVLHREADV